MNVPFLYDGINAYNSSFSPSTIHTDSRIKSYFQKYLLEKIISVYEFKNLPNDWDKAYFLYVLFMIGYIGVFNTNKYGIVCQFGTLNGRGLYQQPTYMNFSNYLFDKTYNLQIGKECGLIKLQPNYSGVMDIVNYYADLLALASETAYTNLMNSKLAYVFFGKNKQQLESFKKMYDNISSGNPSAFIDRQLFDEDGNPQWLMFNQNLKQTYITGDILVDMTKIMDMFNSEIGIPNANTEKKERMILDEVNANNIDTKAKAELWLETLQESIDKINVMYELDITVDFRFKEEAPMVEGGDVNE